MPVWHESCLSKPCAYAQQVLTGLLIHPENLVKGIRFHWRCRIQVNRVSGTVLLRTQLLPRVGPSRTSCPRWEGGNPHMVHYPRHPENNCVGDL